MSDIRTRKGPWEPGDRVNTDYEGKGTVVEDNGWWKIGRRWIDSGVVITVDSDGETMQFAHEQVIGKVE